MQFSLPSLICLLATFQALGSLSNAHDISGAAIRHTPSLRRLDEFGGLFTDAPSMDLNITSEAPSIAPDQSEETSGAEEFGGEDEGSDEMNSAAEGEEGDETREEDWPMETQGDSEWPAEGGEDEAPAESPTINEGIEDDEDDAADGDEDDNEDGDVDDNEDGGEDGNVDDNEDNGEDGDMDDNEDGGEDGDVDDNEDNGEDGDMDDNEDNGEDGGVDDNEDNGEDGGVDDNEDNGEDVDEDFEGFPASSPVAERTEFPTAGRPSYDDAPFPSPSYVPPTPKPYVSNDDERDPILGPTSGGSSTSGAYAWDNSSIEDLEHDRTVIIALSVVFGVMFLFSVIVAHQMLENPHGCCASICRITVACFCVLLRFFCYPCRAMCGCSDRPSKRDHMIVPDDMGNYTHDLELS
ncbi:hypothetical protein IV203_038144 [Nitzschia inconspicua]|uniref:Uncharacterized protein n=1 Tax=Nitzschia inconspicua TaxID=303405 RepID=A0A9K3LQ86_9STRA|nr:hypothetical protein IV203_038144 [Nitzschia inconspicua]